MKLLLDTHVWLWATSWPERLAPRARDVIEDGANEVFFSVASAWEIAIKYALRKLALPHPPEVYVPEHVARAAMTWLVVKPDHALRVAVLPRHHADPFDRLLVAQAQIEQLVLITADPRFEPYGIDVLRAT